MFSNLWKSESSPMNEFVQKELMPQFQRFAELSVQINKPTGEFVEQLKGVMGKLIQGRELQMQGLQREVDEYEGKLNKLFATFWKNGSTQEIVGAQRPKTVFEKQALLKELYEQGKVQKKKRKGEVYELFRKYNRLAALLGTPEKELVQKGRDVSDEAVRRYQGELAQLQADYQTTVVQMQETCVKIDGLFRFLELKRNLNDPLHSIVFSGYSDDSRCKDLVQRKDEINALLGRTRSLKQQRKQMLLDYARDIVCLWDHLGVDQDAQDAFLDQHSGLGEGVVGACIDELRRVLTQRGVQLNGLIAQREGELGKLWKHHKAHKKSDEGSFKAAIAEVLASQQPKSILVSSTAIMDPSVASQAHYNKKLERVVQMQEQETARVTAAIQEPIMAKIEKRQQLLQLKANLDASAELSREMYKSRSRDAAKKIQQEAKDRTKVGKLTKLTSEIQKDIQKFALEMQQPFLIDGRDFLEVIAEEERNEKEAREARDKSRRQPTKENNVPVFERRPIRASAPSAAAIRPGAPRTPGLPTRPSVPSRTPGPSTTTTAAAAATATAARPLMVRK